MALGRRKYSGFLCSALSQLALSFTDFVENQMEADFLWSRGTVCNH